MKMCEAEVIELLTNPMELDDLGRDMVKTRCLVDGKPFVANVYVQHPTDNALIEVGYKFMMPVREG